MLNGKWKKVDLTTYPFNFKDEMSEDIVTEKEYQKKFRIVLYYQIF